MKLTLYICHPPGQKPGLPYLAGIAEYRKRLSRLGELDVITVKNDSAQARRLLTSICQNDPAVQPDTIQYVIVQRTGQSLSSIELADRLQTWRRAGVQRLAFIIGTDYPEQAGQLPDHDHACPEPVSQKLDRDTVHPEPVSQRPVQLLLLSLSPLALSPALSALLLSEQIYRAYKINENQPYHK